jgi:predicted hydrocarbon binding protein
MADAPDAVPEFKDRLVFDDARGELLDGPRRYMLLRPEALMTMFRLLPEEARAAALAALEQAVHQQGSDSARAYVVHGGGDVGTLLETIERTAPQLGWGRWQLQADGERLRLEVRNSPFAHAYGKSLAPVCHGIKGMLRGLADLKLGSPATSVEVHCAAQGRATCLFEASLPTPHGTNSTGDPR